MASSQIVSEVEGCAFNRKQIVDLLPGQQQAFAIQHEQLVLVPFGGLDHGIRGCGAVFRGDPDDPAAFDRQTLLQSLLELFTTQAVRTAAVSRA